MKIFLYEYIVTRSEIGRVLNSTEYKCMWRRNRKLSADFFISLCSDLFYNLLIKKEFINIINIRPQRLYSWSPRQIYTWSSVLSDTDLF